VERIAAWSEGDRNNLFRETGARRNMAPAVVEKDFWVCWTLGRLFASEELGPKLMFKGGTSLSKVFGLIERFSEDIDLILDWKEVTEDDPYAKRSKTKQDAFNKKINEQSREYIKDTLVPDVRTLLGDTCEISGSEDEPDVIHVTYPIGFSNEYLRPEIRLEIGPLAQWMPNDAYDIQPYAAEEFPDLFEEPICRVHAVKAERTFWEKATILHREAHRPEGKPVPSRSSRHYYDLARMSTTDVKQAALDDMSLLRSVVEFKMKFYTQGWAKYELAQPGTLALIPPANIVTDLKKDYAEMRMMIYGEAPAFDDILQVLGALEDEINRLGKQGTQDAETEFQNS